jgi:hypothetical protein
VRAWYCSRPAAERKRRSHALPEASATPPEPDRTAPLTPVEKAARGTAMKSSLAGKAPAFHARLRERGGSHP